MPQTPPLSGPHQFSPSSNNIDTIAAEAAAFIAQRLAGIEWVLGELNLKALSIQSSLALMAGKMT